MSQSARKWLARVDLLKSIYGEEIKTWDRSRAKRELIGWSKKLAHPIAQDLYQAARKLNRVGERLRPCWGCHDCWRNHPSDESCDACGLDVVCGGTEVVPARKARKVRG